MDKYIVNQECNFSLSDEYVIIFNDGKENLFMLDKIGRQIWQLFQTTNTVEAAAKTLVKIYEEEYDVIYRDVLDFVKSLVEEGLFCKV